MVLVNWDMRRSMREFAFSNLKVYLEMIERQFEVVLDMERTRTDSIPPSHLSEDDYLEWQAEGQAEIQLFEERYERDFPSKIRYSFVVLLFIVFEDCLLDTCDEISKRNNLEGREMDLSDPTIKRAINFLTKVANVPLENQQSWQKIKDFQKIRNCIVHTNGRIDESRDKKYLYDLCKKGLGVSNVEGTLMVEKGYCINTLEICSTFFDHLFDSVWFGSSTLTHDVFKKEKQDGIV